MKILKVAICLVFLTQHSFAAEIGFVNDKNFAEQNLQALENSNQNLMNQKATGCQTVCRKNPFSETVTCEEVCSQPTAGLCERSIANVSLLSCMTGGLIGGLIGVGTAPLAYGAAGCLGLTGFTLALRATANCTAY